MFLADMGKAIGGFQQYIQPAVQVAGILTTARGTSEQYNQAAGVARYNESVYNQNADIIERAAKERRLVAEKQKRRYLSNMAAAYGAQGVQLRGSPLLAMAESAAGLEYDIQNEEHDAKIDAMRSRNQAAMYGYEEKSLLATKKRALSNIATQGAYKIFSEY